MANGSRFASEAAINFTAISYLQRISTVSKLAKLRRSGRSPMQNLLASKNFVPEPPALYSASNVAEATPWYVAYARPRHEKHIAHQLEQCGIHSLVPLYSSLRRWKDRKKCLELPLFPCYVFVQIALQRKLELLRLPGVVDLVSF